MKWLCLILKMTWLWLWWTTNLSRKWMENGWMLKHNGLHYIASKWTQNSWTHKTCWTHKPNILLKYITLITLKVVVDGLEKKADFFLSSSAQSFQLHPYFPFFLETRLIPMLWHPIFTTCNAWFGHKSHKVENREEAEGAHPWIHVQQVPRSRLILTFMLPLPLAVPYFRSQQQITRIVS